MTAHQRALAAEARLVEQRLDEAVDLVHRGYLRRGRYLPEGEHRTRQRHHRRMHEVVPVHTIHDNNTSAITHHLSRTRNIKAFCD